MDWVVPISLSTMFDIKIISYGEDFITESISPDTYVPLKQEAADRMTGLNVGSNYV